MESNVNNVKTVENFENNPVNVKNSVRKRQKLY